MDPTTEEQPESTTDQAKRHYGEGVDASIACAAAARLQAEHLERLTRAVVSAVASFGRAADQLVAAFTVAAPQVIAVFSTVAEQIARQTDAAEAILAVNQQLAAGIAAPLVVSLGDVTCGAPGPVGGFTCVLPPHDAEVRHEDHTGGSWSAGPPTPFTCPSRLDTGDEASKVVGCRRSDVHPESGPHWSGLGHSRSGWVWAGDDPRVVSDEPFTCWSRLRTGDKATPVVVCMRSDPHGDADEHINRGASTWTWIGADPRVIRDGDRAPGAAESPGEARGVPVPLGEPVSPTSGQLGGPDDPSAPEVRP